MKRRSILSLVAALPFVSITSVSETSTKPIISAAKYKLPPEATYVINKYNLQNVHIISRWETCVLVRCNPDGTPTLFGSFNYQKYSPVAQIERVVIPVFNLEQPGLFNVSKLHTLDTNVQASINHSQINFDNFNITENTHLVIVENGLGYGIAGVLGKLRLQRDILKEYAPEFYS